MFNCKSQEYKIVMDYVNCTKIHNVISLIDCIHIICKYTRDHYSVIIITVRDDRSYVINVINDIISNKNKKSNKK